MLFDECHVVRVQKQQGGVLQAGQVAYRFADDGQHQLWLHGECGFEHGFRDVQREFQQVFGDDVVGTCHFGGKRFRQSQEMFAFLFGSGAAFFQAQLAALGQTFVTAFLPGLFAQGVQLGIELGQCFFRRHHGCCGCRGRLGDITRLWFIAKGRHFPALICCLLLLWNDVRQKHRLPLRLA